MSVREEERKNNASSSRGLGLAAAAVGVGVGAALYYYFNRRPEDAGQTSSANQQSNSQQALVSLAPKFMDMVNNQRVSSEVVIDILKQSDVDLESIISMLRNGGLNLENYLEMFRSIHFDVDYVTDVVGNTNIDFDNILKSLVPTYNSDYFNISDTLSDYDVEVITDTSDSDESMRSLDSSSDVEELEDDNDTDNDEDSTNDDMSEDSDSDVIEDGYDVDDDDVYYDLPQNQNQPLSPQAQELNEINSQIFRQRSWSLEECSICFDLMLESQENPVQMLKCGHKFHIKCVAEWLNQHENCPNCRKAA